MAQRSWPSISVGSASADSRGQTVYEPFVKNYFVFRSLFNSTYAYSFYPNIILTLKIPSYLIYGLLWHEDNFFIFLSCILLRFFPLKWITLSLLLLSHLDPKFIFPPETAIYTRSVVFVQQICQKNFMFQRWFSKEPIQFHFWIPSFPIVTKIFLKAFFLPSDLVWCLFWAYEQAQLFLNPITVFKLQ